MRRRTWLFFLVYGCLGAGALFAQPSEATIDVRSSAFVKLLRDERQPDRRRYLQGGPNDCDAVYLTGAAVTTVGTRLRLTGRLNAGVDTPLGCVESGEIPIEILAVPAFTDSEVVLTRPELHVAGAHAELLDGVIAPLLEMARVDPSRLLTPLLAGGRGSGGLDFALTQFRITSLQTTPDGVRLKVQFALSVQ